MLFLVPQVLPTDADMAAAAELAGVEVVRLRLPDGVAAGLLHVEVQRGALCCLCLECAGHHQLVQSMWCAMAASCLGDPAYQGMCTALQAI